MTDPTDVELWKFIAEFVGWYDLFWTGSQFNGRTSEMQGRLFKVPGYLNSVDSFIRDVVPKIEQQKKLTSKWCSRLQDIVGWYAIAPLMNASARQRCLALHRALDGKLPGRG